MYRYSRDAGTGKPTGSLLFFKFIPRAIHIVFNQGLGVSGPPLLPFFSTKRNPKLPFSDPTAIPTPLCDYDGNFNMDVPLANNHLKSLDITSRAPLVEIRSGVPVICSNCPQSYIFSYVTSLNGMT